MRLLRAFDEIGKPNKVPIERSIGVTLSHADTYMADFRNYIFAISRGRNEYDRFVKTGNKRLPPKIILQPHNIIFIRRMPRLGMLPDFSDYAPVVEADQPVALALVELDHVAGLKGLEGALDVVGTGDHADGAFHGPPQLGAPKMVLPGKALVRRH